MTYVDFKISGVKLLFNPETFLWHMPNDITEQRYAGKAGAQVYYSLEQDIIQVNGWLDISLVNEVQRLATLRNTTRAITLDADLFKQYYPATGRIYAVIEDLIINEQAAYLNRYPWKGKFHFICDADNYRRGTRSNVTTLYNTFSAVSKPVLVLPPWDGALSFVAASSQYTTNASSTGTSLTTGITIQAWVKPTTLIDSNMIIKRGTGGTHNYAFSTMANGAVDFFYEAAGPVVHEYKTAASVIPLDGFFHHVLVSYTFGTGSSLVIYVDGVAVTGSWIDGTGNSAPVTSDATLQIGKDGSSYANGAVCNVAIYNTAFTAAQALSEFVNHSPTISSGTIGHWRLNEWTGTSNYDGTRNNTLTMTNSPTFVGGIILGTVPNMTASGFRYTEFGTVPYVANFTGNTAFYDIADGAIAGDDSIEISRMLNEYIIKNGMLKVRTRNDESVATVGQFDLSRWDNQSTMAYTAVGQFYIKAYDLAWQDLSTLVPTVTPISQQNDMENGAWHVTWQGASTGLTLMAVMEMLRGKPFIKVSPTNVGSPTIKGIMPILNNPLRYHTRYNIIMDANVFPTSVVTNVGNQAIGGDGTVNTSANSTRSFWANGLWWVFYWDATNIVFKTSSDGNTWSAATNVRAIANGADFSIFFDGTYVHYTAIQNRTAGASVVYYRRATPNSDGTLTYSAAEQTAKAAVAGNFHYEPTICVTAAGLAYIGYGYNVAASQTPYVTKNTASDGTWATAAAFPFQLSATASAVTTATVVQLTTTDNVYAIYGVATATIKGKLWNGSAWSAEETASSTNVQTGPQFISVTPSGNDIHIAFLNTVPNVIYLKRTGSSSTWSAETTIQAAVTATSAPGMELDVTGDLYIFWIGSPSANHIYYKKYDSTANTWDTNPTDWITAAAVKSNDRIVGFYLNGPLGILYSEANGGANIDVKFALLIDDIPAGADDRNYNYLMDTATLAAGTNVECILTRTKANDRRYRAVRSGATWTLFTQYFNTSSSATIGTGVDTEVFWVGVYKYLEANDNPSEYGKEMLATTDNKQEFVRVT